MARQAPLSLKRRVAELAARALARAVNALGRVGALRKLFLLAGPRLDFGVCRVRQNGSELLFQATNEITLFRAESFLSKEPETLAWIDSFAPGSVLYDVGANVGTYSIYAARRDRAGQVVALEPESQNYAALNRNIALNRLDDRIRAFNLALSDETKLGPLRLSVLETGGANHTFDRPLDHEGRPWEGLFHQGALSFTLDELIERFSPPFPNHIKIDVDGLEPKIIAGGRRTLRDSRVYSLLIEVNEGSPEFESMLRELEAMGFKTQRRPHAAMFDDGPYARYYNYVLTRE